MAWSASNLLGSLADKVSATSKTVTGITANVGDLVIFGGEFFSGGNGLTGATVSDSSANTWTVIGSGSTLTRGFLAYCVIAVGKALSSGTVTLTRTGTTNITAFSGSVVSFTGGVTSSIEDSSARATASGTGLTPSVTSGTPTTAGDLFVGVLADGFSTAVPTYTEATGWTNANNLATAATNGALGAIAYQVNAGTGTLTHNPVLVGLGTHNWNELVTAFLVGGGSSVSGDVAWTEAQDSWAAAGGPVIDGASAWTEAQDAWAASGTIAWIGNAAWTEAQDAWAGAGSVIIDGSVAWVETQDSWAASGQLGVLGIAAWIETQDIWAASGSITQPAISGDAAWTEIQDSWNGQGTAGAQGGHFIPLTERQLREIKKRERRERQAREDIEDYRRLDALGIEANIRATLAPSTITQEIPVNYAEDTVNEDWDEEDVELLLAHA